MRFLTKKTKTAALGAALASVAFFGGWENFDDRVNFDDSLKTYVFAQESENGADNRAAVEFAEAKGVSYYSSENLKDADDYQKSQCRVDILYPKKPGFATIVWFHGGGLTGGGKCVPSAFKRLKSFQEGRLAIVAVGYRLSPKVPFPVFIEDAAAATAWTLRNIGEYGGDPNAVFVSGGSAGGYLTAMIGAYPKWLNARGADRSELAGLLPVSGQMTTHFHVKELLKYPGDQYNPVIDANAPLGGLSKDFPPTMLILGDRKIEWKCRVEENELMAASLKALGAPLVEFSENAGFTHGISGMGDDIKPELLAEIDAFLEKALALKKSAM
ncbi:MAG: alpha/beta hydrolase fold domain-containing protein [Thermoguttaceae bacterium]|nr:alpha/beta hydrolase fold domain-containing protein [Thermoguttaceae bacterium]